MGDTRSVRRVRGPEGSATRLQQPPAPRGEAREPEGHVAGTVLALQHCAGNRAVSRRLLQRAWTDEDVYTVTRERLPGMRESFSAALKLDPRERFPALEQLQAEIAKQLADSRGGRYRLGRTYEYAVAAQESLEALQRTVADAREATRPFYESLIAADALVERHEQARKSLQRLTAERQRVGATDRSKRPPVEAGLEKVETDLAKTLYPAQSVREKMEETLAKAEQWASGQLRLLQAAEGHLLLYLETRVDVEADLDAISDLFEEHKTDPLPRRTALKKKYDALRVSFNQLKADGEAARQLRDEGDVKRLGAPTTKLSQLKKQIVALGGEVEEAIDELGPRRGAGPAAGRTGLPTIKTSVAAALTDRAEMLVAAVKEARKNPAWLQAATDFALHRLALGRPDHIHISGGGNTLIYQGNLIRGFMSEHLDSRPESQLKANKIKGRELTQKVEVVVDGGNLKEVVKG